MANECIHPERLTFSSEGNRPLEWTQGRLGRGAGKASDRTAAAFGEGPLVRLDEVDPHLVAVNPRHLAAAESHAGRRQRQKELVEVETAQRLVKLKQRSLLRHVEDVAGSKP